MRIERLPAPEYSGDWHDPPLRWAVIGPGEERQHFRNRANARLWKKLRSQCETLEQAFALFCAAPEPK